MPLWFKWSTHFLISKQIVNHCYRSNVDCLSYYEQRHRIYFDSSILPIWSERLDTAIWKRNRSERETSNGRVSKPRKIYGSHRENNSWERFLRGCRVSFQILFSWYFKTPKRLLQQQQPQQHNSDPQPTDRQRRRSRTRMTQPGKQAFKHVLRTQSNQNTQIHNQTIIMVIPF